MAIFLTLFYLFAVSLCSERVWRAYRQNGFSFYSLFGAIYLVTFFFGYPLSLLLASYFDHQLPDELSILATLLLSSIGFMIFSMSYGLLNPQYQKNPPIAFANFHAKTTACLLLLVSLISLVLFIYLNEGLLLFRLEKYSQIFSAQVQGVALKRFFYFFLPALLIWFCLKPSKFRWWWFLAIGIFIGVLNYLAIGGTRANIALAFGFFVLLGLWQGYLAMKWSVLVGAVAVVAMFFLALARYNLDLQGAEIWHTFLYLTHDTFSPWENIARIMNEEIEYQGLMPIVRDFYVYIPKILWADRPDIVWNTANYFTKVVLGNQSGLAISPTLLGSFYIMAGWLAVIVGMGLIGFIIKGGDILFEQAKGHPQKVVIQAYCLGNLFNLMVLIREGFDAFVSRWVFFSLVFGGCWLLALVIIKGMKRG